MKVPFHAHGFQRQALTRGREMKETESVRKRMRFKKCSGNSLNVLCSLFQRLICCKVCRNFYHPGLIKYINRDQFRQISTINQPEFFFLFFYQWLEKKSNPSLIYGLNSCGVLPNVANEENNMGLMCSFVDKEW